IANLKTNVNLNFDGLFESIFLPSFATHFAKATRGCYGLPKQKIQQNWIDSATNFPSYVKNLESTFVPPFIFLP
ncbi:MAG: hypothetical protein Q8M92_04515, partial [Candidatus Subteraquimicrobiales bacterium]|nr:hypothetical protein [Candidatus Subteraquimicrobiales bacterium]